MKTFFPGTVLDEDENGDPVEVQLDRVQFAVPHIGLVVVPSEGLLVDEDEERSLMHALNDHLHVVEGDSVAVEDLSVVTLRGMAADRGLELPAKAKKAEILAALAADENEAAGTDDEGDEPRGDEGGE